MKITNFDRIIVVNESNKRKTVTLMGYGIPNEYGSSVDVKVGNLFALFYSCQDCSL